MTREEAGKLLILMHHFVPSYQPPKGAAESWAEVLGEIPFEEARGYLIEHFRESEYPLKPVDLIRRAREKREKRIDDLVQLDMQSFWNRVGEQSSYEAKIKIYAELYCKLFANQLGGDPIEEDDVETALQDFVLAVPPTSRERAYRSMAIIHVFQNTRRFLMIDEMLQKAAERVESLLRRDEP
jgi:hypothetical protein